MLTKGFLPQMLMGRPLSEEHFSAPGGLHEDSRKQLQHKRDCTNQILKAAMAINSISLADMEVPESFVEALPKV